MKRLVTFMSAVLIACSLIGKSEPVNEGKGIQFKDGSLADAIVQAKAQKKLVFIDIYATWCSPCMLLKLKTFPSKAAGEFFNSNFINVSLNGEKGEGLRLFNAFGFHAFPTMVVLNSDGKPVIYAQGYLDPKTLIEFGKEAIDKAPKISQ